MTKNSNLRKAILVCTGIVTIGAAVAALAPYVPWAPRITFSMAAENTRTRLYNDLTALVIMLGQAEATKNASAIATLRGLIAEKKEQLEDLKREKAKNQ